MLHAVISRARRFLFPEKPVGKVQTRCTRRRIGTRYGGATICPVGLNAASTVYSVGIGEDLSFDLAMIRAFGCTVCGFDPTPKSIAWVRGQRVVEKFRFYEFGLAGHDGDATFYPPESPHEVSASVVHRPGTTSNTITVPVRRLKTTMESLGHQRLDVLKLDIEGAEYDVVDDILSSWNGPPPVRQMLVEFHHRFFPDGLERTRYAIEALSKRGFKIFNISRNGIAYSFIREQVGVVKTEATRGAFPVSEAGRVALRVAVVTNVLPHYRSAFYRLLFQRRDMDVHVFCQASIPGMNLELVHGQFPQHVTLVPVWSATRDRLGWQRLPWRTLLSSFDVVFVLGNPRVLSNVVLATLARIAGKGVVVWGQAHTAGGRPFTEGLRLAWWRTFTDVFVYTDGEARRLKARGFRRQHVVGMNNGLDQEEIDAAASEWKPSDCIAWRRREGLDGRKLILSCARMEPKNRLELWVQALPAVVARYPDVLWCAIGDGAERPSLEAQVNRMGLGAHVRWVGAVVDEGRLAPWFLSSELLVHPAGIGLTLLHAFGYGLPVVTSDDAEMHMPEFDAFVPGETGLLYRHGDVASLAATVCRCLEEASTRERMGRRGRQIARGDYNVRVMVDRFAAIASHAAAHSRRTDEAGDPLGSGVTGRRTGP